MKLQSTVLKIGFSEREVQLLQADAGSSGGDVGAVSIKKFSAIIRYFMDNKDKSLSRYLTIFETDPVFDSYQEACSWANKVIGLLRDLPITSHRFAHGVAFPNREELKFIEVQNPSLGRIKTC